MQKVKFILGFSDFGGSTIAIINQAKLLEKEFNVEIYGTSSFLFRNYENSKILEDLEIEPDDILIYHFMENDERPNCKKCFLYVHEKSVFELKDKKINGFDNFIFVSKSQRMYHGFNGHIIPNRIIDFIGNKKCNPPNNKIAGVVGTIQIRKNTHVSICRALENGCNKVLLFGNTEPDYFKKIIQPMLSEKVVYKGLYEDRMEMYNEFDDLYHFSKEECASLTIGECQILGKKIFKNEECELIEILEDHEILEKWKSLFQS